MKGQIRTGEFEMYVKEIVSVKQITYATLKEALKSPGLNGTGLGFNGPSCRSPPEQTCFPFPPWFFRNAISHLFHNCDDLYGFIRQQKLF